MTSTSQALKPTFGRSFHLLWAGQSASLIGDQITLIALPLVAVTFAHGTPADVGLLGACLRIPFLLIGLQAGVWVGRLGLARSMLAADIVRGLAIALVVMAIGLGAADLWLLVIAVSAVGVATVFFQVSYQSFVPEIVSQEGLWHGANTRLTLSESLSLLIGPAVGGLAIGLLTLRGALVLDVMTYVASVISLALILVGRASARTRDPAPIPRIATRRAVWEGMRYVRRSPVLRAIMWTGAAYNLGAAMFETLLVLFGIQTPARRSDRGRSCHRHRWHRISLGEPPFESLQQPRRYGPSPDLGSDPVGRRHPRLSVGVRSTCVGSRCRRRVHRRDRARVLRRQRSHAEAALQQS
ncbi:transmembrane secretion effector [Kribbella orskensis]|uniref:Transmembrane secretion effector n=1 Tax=Kribbella orskensis TaxID=2512216 RepID=A0ABY2BUV8_9ACTN|nr:transmembrane secretion effector [Kribbella sp. VKM Ac-2500]TCO32017.1 transmembrane secretion effector [Kribbella orskensis]